MLTICYRLQTIINTLMSDSVLNSLGARFPSFRGLRTFVSCVAKNSAKLEGGTPHASSDGVFMSPSVGVKNDDSVAAAQVTLPYSGISKPVEPAAGKWRDMFSSNRNTANCPTIVHFSDSSNAENYTLLDGDLDNNCDVWKLCVVANVAGKFPGFKALTSMIGNTWKCDASLTIHDSGRLINKFNNEDDKLFVLSGGPCLVYGRPLVLKSMPEYFDFASNEMTRPSLTGHGGRPPQEAVLKAISAYSHILIETSVDDTEVSRTEGRVGQTTNVVIGGTVADDSTNEWLALDKKVNSYPTVRGFTAIGTGGDDFVQAMVIAVESVIQQPIPEGRVRQKVSSRGKYVSVNIGPVQVVSSEQVQAVYNAMRRDDRMKYFL
ncbi:PREDICTED: uncharacterized protein LOC105109244 [Populus euphratica]|uniref:Uncharacterized protein LOC105109244 n=1 Tax=Populus euphratica TaxID=75702 RepID=A0AAJ6T053_POPEU|nr:PREDICTED: uncharacterized protein LOC105109244 [Populus euphratica]